MTGAIDEVLIENGFIVRADDTFRADLCISRGVGAHIAKNPAPAKIIELYPRKGDLSDGSDGDVIIFDPEQEKTITPANLHHNADHSPHEAMYVRGWPTATLARGRIVMQQDQLLVEKGWGEYVPRHPMPDPASTKEITK